MPNASFNLINADEVTSCYDVSSPEYGMQSSPTCTLNYVPDTGFTLWGSFGMLLLSNTSTDGQVKTYIDGNGTNFAYLGVPTRDDNYDVDFSGHSWALSSSCTPITSECITVISGPQARYNCSSIAFAGTIATNSVNQMTMEYYIGANMSEEAQGNVSVGNPYYHAAIASVNQNTGFYFSDDPEVAEGLHSATIIVVACNTTVWDVEYTSTNGSISRFVTSPSNASLANIMLGTQAYTQVANAILTQAFSTGAWIGNSAQDIADYFASQYSLSALSLGGSATTPSLATEAQLRTQMLVARVPLAPLGALVASNLLLVVLGLALTVWALGTARGDVREVQARLGVVGLVGSYFEGETAQRPVRHAEDIFGEKSGLTERKVGIFKTPLGGWVLGAGSY